MLMFSVNTSATLEDGACGLHMFSSVILEINWKQVNTDRPWSCTTVETL